MTPYQIQGPARICSITGRELKPGERFYSALLDEAGQLLRKDFASDAWKEPPVGAIAFWTGKIPTSDRPVKPIINEELLLDCCPFIEPAIFGTSDNVASPHLPLYVMAFSSADTSSRFTKSLSDLV